MTKQDLTDQIEAEFGWLSPDEKQKLFVMLKSNWNDAIILASKTTKDLVELDYDILNHLKL